MEKFELLFKKIELMHEDDFSRDIVIPLLKKMGYEFTDFNGGSYELGKDIIATKLDDFNQIEVTVIQSKMLKTQRMTASSRKFGEIAHQLRLCLDKKIPCTDGFLRFATKVILITPYQIDTRHLSEQFETITIKGILIIDRPRLQELLIKFWPEIFETAASILGKASNIDKNEIINTELHKALHIEPQENYSEYYSDLSFFVGETESRKVFSSKIIVTHSGGIEHNQEDWKEIKKIDSWINRLTNENLIIGDAQSIEQKFTQELQQHQSQRNQLNIKKLNDYRELVAGQKEKLKNILKDLKSDTLAVITTKKTQAPKSEEDLRNHEKISTSLETIIDLEQTERYLKTLSTFCETTKKLTQETKILSHCENILDITKESERIQIAISKLESQTTPYPMYLAELNTAKSTANINNTIKDTAETITTLNNHRLTTAETRKILEEIHSTLRCIDTLINNFSCSSLSYSLIDDTHTPKTLDISAHTLFDSGCNIAVYGEAGAGKSTTLHVYAERMYRNKSDDEVILFIPLNRVTSKTNKIPPLEREKILNNTKSFETLIKTFLIYKDIPPSIENQRDLISSLNSKKRVVIILDALDEAASNTDWIIPALSEIPEHINNAQVITSSRDCVKFIKKIEFLGITLLPFNKNQLRKFIFGWLKNEEQKLSLWEKLQEDELFEVARNPLLATIICTLHENGRPIPENEPAVYRSKIDLLCGLYDQFKDIKRTINDKGFLEECCRKLAYQMHRREQREATHEEIHKFLSEGLGSSFSQSKIDSALDDLISSCNILKYTHENKTYSFGHLRYQEYLASEELSRTRSISLIELTPNSWWAGALYLYSFGNRIQPIIDEIYEKHGTLIPHRKNLTIMIKSQPKESQKNLYTLINNHIQLDRHEGYSDRGFIYDEPEYIQPETLNNLLGY